MTEKAPHALRIKRREILQILDRISLFGGLNPTQLEVVLGLLSEADYQDGEQIFARGDQPSYIYIVQVGQVRLDFEVPGHPFSDIRFGAGDCLGETSVIGIQPHSASAIAVGPTCLLVLSREVLLKLHETDLALFGLVVLNIAREAARRLHAADEWIARLVAAR